MRRRTGILVAFAACAAGFRLPARLSRPLAPRASPSTRRAAGEPPAAPELGAMQWDAQAKQWYDPATRASQVEDLVANAQSLFTRVYPKGPRTALQNVLAGGTVSLAMIPEAVAFAFVAGVNPLVGLWSTVVLGLFAAALGGRAGMVSGASGACAVCVAELVRQKGPALGPSYLSAAVVLAGVLQCAVGRLGLGKFITIVPQPAMLGFVNGLAIVMTRAQLTHFRDRATGAWLSGAAGATMCALTALAAASVKLAPRLTTAVPPALAAVGLTTAVAKLLRLPATTLADIAGAATFRGGLSVLPRVALPAPWRAAPLATLGLVLPFAASMAAAGLIESLLTMQLVDGLLDDGTRGDTRAECFGQGVGNVLSGLTGGMGGCVLIGQSLINVGNGGTSRLSGIAMSLLLAAGIVGAAPLLGQVPIASLVGVMLVVCQGTFAWSSLRIMRKIPRVDALVVLAVSYITVVADLAVAVVAGTILSALAFAWKQSTSIAASVDRPESAASSSTSAARPWPTYRVKGPLFFASTARFADLFDAKGDPDDVIIDFAESRVCDHSALEAINALAAKYATGGKRVHLRHLSSDCAGLLRRLNGFDPAYELIEADPATDPVYEVAEDSKVYKDVPAPSLAGVDVAAGASLA